MIIYNVFASSKINSPENSDEYMPVAGLEYPDTLEFYDETDGKITLRQSRYYNSNHELWLITKWAVVDPVVISDVTGDLVLESNSSVVITGSGFGAEENMSVFLEYPPNKYGCYEPSVRKIGVITGCYPTSLAVTFDLVHVWPRMVRGAGKIIVQDHYRGLEESIPVIIG